MTQGGEDRPRIQAAEPERKPDGPLRRGWTTGATAAAGAAAAYQGLLTGGVPRQITITLPKGEEPCFEVVKMDTGEGWARVGILKDGGDDPDVTHGAEIVTEVKQAPAGTGVSFHAGAGVGTVTKPGLPLKPGEPAINPGPRGMIESALTSVHERHGNGAPGPDLSVTIAIPNGEKLAEKTMNGRLGIKGGLSILGTTGVVIPYSCASWINAIHRSIDVGRAAGLTHMAAATGSTSEAAVQKLLRLDEAALIDMGDFAGGMLKYLRRHPIPKLTLAGGFGKLAKLAQGSLDLHSARSSIDLSKLAAAAAELGGADDLIKSIDNANTGLEALSHAQAAGIPLAGAVAKGAREVALATLSGETDVTVLVFDRQGELTGRSDA